MNNFEKIDILLVEDNPYDAELSLRALQKKKLANNVEWVQDGADALDFLFCSGVYVNRPKGELPRLILLDIKLPRVSGIEVLRKVRPVEPSIRFIVLTNNADVQYRKVCMAAGADHFLDKASEFEKVKHLISA